MSFQTCPLCKGKGYLFTSGISTSCTEPCTVCTGQKIISILTGKPPSTGITNLTPQEDYKITPKG